MYLSGRPRNVASSHVPPPSVEREMPRPIDGCLGRNVSTDSRSSSTSTVVEQPQQQQQ